MTTPGSAAFRAAQRGDLLRFAAASRVQDGFGWLDDEGRVDGERPTELWITCRMTHVAALGLLANEAALHGGPDGAQLGALVAHGVQSLSGPLRDATHTGWFASVKGGAPVDASKQAYGHAFVVLAASSAMVAGDSNAAALLADALEVSTERFWDDDRGLVVDQWDRAWTVCDPYRGLNANMHTVEAYLAAGDAAGDTRWHERAGRVCAQVVAWARAHDWRIPEHFSPAWEPLLEHHRDRPADPFQPYGATVGHGLEWSRLLLAADESLGSAAPSGLKEAAGALYDRAVADGWSSDGAEGFVYTTDWQGKTVVHERMHWVLTEAINAAVALQKLTGDDRYERDRRLWWAYADAHLIDHDRGSWRHELDRFNRPSTSVWHGKPDVYHAYQAAVLEDLVLVPSFATALAQKGYDA